MSKTLILIAVLFLSIPSAYAETKPISIEFKLLCSKPSSACEKMQIRDSKEVLYLQKETQFTLVDIKDAQIKINVFGNYEILLTFTKISTKRLVQVTADNIGKRMGIVIDGKLVMAPVIHESIKNGEISISGAGITETFAAGIVNRIKNALGISLKVSPVYAITAEDYFHSAKEDYKKGNFAQAIVDLNKLIEISPHHAEAYNDRGLAYSHLKNYSKAIANFNKAIELNPNDSKAFNNRGLAYDTQGNYPQAIADYTKSIKLSLMNAKAYFNRGIAYSHQKNYSQAIADSCKAIEINSRYAKAYNNRGYYYFKLGKINQAMSDYNKSIEINPNTGNSYDGLAQVYFYNKDYKNAWINIHKAKSLGYKANKDDKDGLEFLDKLKKASGRDQ